MAEILLNKVEKEKRVIELHLEGKTIREIAKEVRMAFRDICNIIKRHNKKTRLQQTKKEQEDNIQSEQKPTKKLSKSSQAFQLFREGKKLIDVAIELDIPAEKVERLWSQFLNLDRMNECYEFYQECQSDLPTFLSINNFMKRNNAYGNDIANVLRQAKTIANLQIHLTIIKNEIERLQKVKNNYQQYSQNNQHIH